MITYHANPQDTQTAVGSLEHPLPAIETAETIVTARIEQYGF